MKKTLKEAIIKRDSEVLIKLWEEDKDNRLGNYTYFMFMNIDDDKRFDKEAYIWVERVEDYDEIFHLAEEYYDFSSAYGIERINSKKFVGAYGVKRW